MWSDFTAKQKGGDTWGYCDIWLGFEDIGVHLTENGAMTPHASVSGLMLAHPAACYFAVGKIGNDQLEDYARRRGLPVETMRKFLAANL